MEGVLLPVRFGRLKFGPGPFAPAISDLMISPPRPKRPRYAGFGHPFTAKNDHFAAIDAQLAANDTPNTKITGHTLFWRGHFAALHVPNVAWRVRVGRMDTLDVTMDMYYAAIDGHYAAKNGLFAAKLVVITAKGVSIVMMIGHFAVKCGDYERTRVSFAVIRVEHAAMRGPNAAKRVSLAVMRVHYARIGTSNAAMEALITAKCASIVAT